MSQHVMNLSGETWDRDVLDSEEPVLVDFWAPWCTPCRTLAPVLEAAAARFGPRFRVGKLDVDEHPEVAARYGIRSIPTLLVFRSGAIVERRVGMLGEGELTLLMKEHLEPSEAIAPAL